MRYMIIVKATPESEAGVLPGEEMISAMVEYHEELAKAGVLRDASGLQPTSQGWRVRYSGGNRTIVDGPFTETKELIAGYTLIEVGTREEAIAWTGRFPNPVDSLAECEIEVRPLYGLNDFEKGPAVERFRRISTPSQH